MAAISAVRMNTSRNYVASIPLGGYVNSHLEYFSGLKKNSFVPILAGETLARAISGKPLHPWGRLVFAPRPFQTGGASPAPTKRISWHSWRGWAFDLAQAKGTAPPRPSRFPYFSRSHPRCGDCSFLDASLSTRGRSDILAHPGESGIQV